MSGETPRPCDSIAELAERCVQHVRQRFDFELDYSPETLGVLDAFVEAVVAEERESEKPPPGDRRGSHLVHLLAPSVGAYFGEVVRRRLPCRWRLRDGEPKSWLIEFEKFFLRFNPAGAAAEAIAMTHVEGWEGSLSTEPDETEDLHRRLEAAPSLPEDQFFSLATRWEVLQIADDWLRRRGAAEGALAEMRTESDYDTVFEDK
ncbi:MAG: hypothetical protein R6V85_12010 [Polyangia bacterium]